jgi:hypothetical protein
LLGIVLLQGGHELIVRILLQNGVDICLSARASEAARTRTIEDSLHFARRSVFDELCGRRELLCVRRHVPLLSLPGTTPRARWRSRLKLSKLLGLQPRGCQAPQAAWKFSGLRKVKPHPPSLLQSSFPPPLSPLSLSASFPPSLLVLVSPWPNSLAPKSR